MDRLSHAGELAINLFDNAVFPGGLNPGNAWLGIYQVLLWYESLQRYGISDLPHIIDADKLKPGRQGSNDGIWQRRAQAVAQYLAKNLNCEVDQVSGFVDRLMKDPSYKGMQRQNPLGNAFPILIFHALELLGNKNIQYEREVSAQTIFPGVVVPGRSDNVKIDIVARSSGRVRAILSCKWSLRHDRLNDISNECPTYKAAASWTRSTIDYIVMTNEFDPARLNKLLEDSCVDAVVHVHKPLLTSVCSLNSRIGEMLDLTELVERSQKW